MKRILIAGASNNTGNLGVSALGNSAASAIHSIMGRDCEIYLQNDSRDIAKIIFQGGKEEFEVTGVSLRPSRNLINQDSLYRIIGEAIFPVLPNKYRDVVDRIDFVLDVAGGDSFSDIYGRRRFDIINLPKDLAKKYNIPYALLPQTYGPFFSEDVKVKAKSYVLGARQAWARDLHSFQNMKSLLGSDFDPGRHKLGVDMAFGLPLKDASNILSGKVKGWIVAGKKIVGINVSGLIFNNDKSAKEHYKFKADYAATLKEIVSTLISTHNCYVVLIPHVQVDLEHEESDLAACYKLKGELAQYDEYIAIQERGLDQCEVKYLISQCEWFMGTRMHATIAGLSSCTPTATISYSDKALGVFESCGVGDEVVDPRLLGTEEVTACCIQSFLRRKQTLEILKVEIPKVKRIAEEQIQDILRHME